MDQPGRAEVSAEVIRLFPDECAPVDIGLTWLSGTKWATQHLSLRTPNSEVLGNYNTMTFMFSSSRRTVAHTLARCNPSLLPSTATCDFYMITSAKQSIPI